METREIVELLKVLHMLARDHSNGSEVVELANQKIIEILKNLL